MSAASVPHLVVDCEFTHSIMDEILLVDSEQYCQWEVGIVDSFFLTAVALYTRFKLYTRRTTDLIFLISEILYLGSAIEL